MANPLKVETRLLAATTANQAVDWGGPPIQKLYVLADGTTARIDFDQPTDAGSFPILTANVAFELDVPHNVTHISTSSSTANVYLIGIR